MRWKNVWIIGASTGIGKELALKLSEICETVCCSARSADKLAALSEKSSNIKSYPLDVTDREAMSTVCSQVTADHGDIDLVIYNPGVWLPYKSIKEFSVEDCKQSMDVNYMGAIYLLGDLLPRMIERNKGHIALVGSIAGYRGMKRIAAYGPTKAALNNLAETLKLDLVNYKIDVSIINPGFVDTPMTAVNDFNMPFIIPADDAADRIIKGLEKRSYEIAFPFPMVRFFKRLRSMPNSMFFWVAKRFL